MSAALGETERLREQIEELRKSIHGCAGNAAVSSIAGPPFRYAMDALYLIDGMAERLARVEAEERERCAKQVPTNWCDPILTGPRAVFNPNDRPEPNVERVLAAVAAAIRAGK